MKNNNQHIDEQLLVAILEERATDQDKLNFQNWIDATPENEEIFQKMLKIWKSSKEIEVFQRIDEAADWKMIKAKSGKSRKLNTTKLVMRYAATVLVLISLSLVYLYQTTPGFGKYAQSHAIMQKEQILLADGTEVFLNKKSKIIYPKYFNSKIRNVELEGEAYFQVKRNPNKPFIIKSGDAIIEVLGTSFNVNNKPDGTTIVSVNSGKVSLKNQNTGELVYLTKGEKGIIQKQELSESVNKEFNYKSWKTGVLVFKETPMKKVFADLEQHYGVKITNKSLKIDTLTYTNTFTNAKLDKVIEELKIGLKVHVSQKGNHLIISDENN
ncbi:MAG: FecR domain-containing protein [Labilibaculum sp.]|nr:FecR family protein [Labilibaculum sp.]MBI9058583.1 FecR domain-containing protein [Labilibaculum sp.]